MADTLGYAQRLRDAGAEQKIAETHAAAARGFIMADLVTKTDLQQAVIAVNARIDLLEQRIETQSLRLTVRLGMLMAAGHRHPGHRAQADMIARPLLDLAFRGDRQVQHDPTRIFQNTPIRVLGYFGFADLDSPASQHAIPVENGTGLRRSLSTSR
jgi:hypothetical protein